jgi:Holliday junction resolvase
MRRAARIDDNQKELVKALRKAGCKVLSLAAVGNGCPDLIVYRANVLTMLEIKDGNKAPSRRKLTTFQDQFRADWPVQVVTDIDSALQAVGLQEIK